MNLDGMFPEGLPDDLKSQMEAAMKKAQRMTLIKQIGDACLSIIMYTSMIALALFTGKVLGMIWVPLSYFYIAMLVTGIGCTYYVNYAVKAERNRAEQKIKDVINSLGVDDINTTNEPNKKQ